MVINLNKKFDEKGSVTVETAILFPAAIMVLMFGYACINLCINYFSIGYCFNKTAEQMTDYAYIYHEKIIANISSGFEDKLKSDLNDTLDNMLEGVPDLITGNIDIKGYIENYSQDFLDKAEDQIYIPLAGGLFASNLIAEGSSYDVLYVDFSKSEFFHNNNVIILDMTCKIKFMLPFFDNDGIQMNYRIKTNAWVNGIGKTEQENIDDIWSLSNFERGKKIRSLFGGNLPDNYPVISGFKDGRAYMIKSLDFRKESYSVPGAISNAASRMIANLSSFNGREKPFGKEEIVIRANEIKEKELILVIPEGEQNDLVKSELSKIENIANIYGIIYTVKKI